MTEFPFNPQQPTPSPEESEATVAELVEVVRSALAKPESADRTALGKVASQLRNVNPTHATDGQFEALQGVCRYFLAQDRDLAFAMEAAAYMIKIARQLNRKHALMNGLIIQSVIATQLDNSVEAIESCASAREVAIEVALPRGELVAVMNGAACMINNGDYERALELLRGALIIADRCSNSEDAEAAVLANIAQCHLFLDNFEEGLEAIGAARALSAEPTDSHSAGVRTILEYTNLRLLVALHRHEEAAALLPVVAKYATQAGSVRAKIDYTVAKGMVEYAAGKHDLGMSRMVKARETAKLVRSTLPDVLSAMVTLHTIGGNTEEAKKCRDELNSLFRSRQETSRLRAALLLGPQSLGVGAVGHSSETSEYDRRFDAARERLLRSLG